MRPTSSITASTFTSLWVSTPPRTLHPTPDRAIVVMPLLPSTGLDGTHRRAGGQDSDRAFRTGASSVTFAQPVRATHRASLTRPTDHFQGTNGPADLRVRPSERDPARSLPARGTRRANHHCRSVRAWR